MKLATLFRFYKEPEICENRLQILKKYNPDLQIFGLYGGPAKDTEKYKEKLGKYFDDFYTSPYTDSYRKREHGDLVLLERYTSNGEKLPRDSIFIIQWDMLVFSSLKETFADYQKDQFYISGTKILDPEIESKRSWTSKDEKKTSYIQFQKLIKEKYGYIGPLFCSLFIFPILPRIFLDQYSKIQENEIGFLEYKLPTYAKVFGLDFYEKDVGVRRFQKDGICPQNARGKEISSDYILQELQKPDGWRIFHPYFKTRPSPGEA